MPLPDIIIIVETLVDKRGFERLVRRSLANHCAGLLVSPASHNTIEATVHVSPCDTHDLLNSVQLVQIRNPSQI